MENFGEPILIQALRAHRGEVTCVDASGGRLITGGGDRFLRLWRWTAGSGWIEEALAKAAHRYGVTGTRWSPGAALIASSGVDGAVRVWCGRTLTARRLLAAPAAPAVRSLCWAGFGRLLAGHDDGALCIWHVLKSTMLTRLVAHEGALHAVAAPARGALLLTACTHGVLKVFDLEGVCRTGSEGGTPPLPLTWIDGAHDLGALCADASDDGKAAATGGHDSRVRLWRVNQKVFEEGPTLEGHAAAVTSVRWCRAVLASASLDRTARLWTTDGACVRVLHAHARYLTCVALSHDLRFLITGSNDKSVRMWSLDGLTIDDELEVKCSALTHFGLGDLEGIGPVEDDDLLEAEASGGMGGEVDGAGGSRARRVWHSKDLHGGAVNCITTYEDLLATASSDGLVRIFRWQEGESDLRLEHELDAHGYPALAAEFGAGGELLLTAGLDGQAIVWDVQTGCRLRSLSAVNLCAECDTGGGGVRGARVSPHKPPLLLLATDDGVAPVWSLGDADPAPTYIYGDHADAVTCCAWSHDGCVVATGAASGELRLHAAPPRARTVHCEPNAHDLGVQSCDFAPSGSSSELEDGEYLLATAGCDQLTKLWIVTLNEELDEVSASVRLVRRLEAHGGAVTCVRWGDNGLLATGGVDEWARVWQASSGRCVAAVPAGAAGAAVAASLLAGGLLAIGTLAGELAIWRLPDLDETDEDEDDDVGSGTRFWGELGVVRWLREYVTRFIGSTLSRDEEATLLHAARTAHVTGARLLDDPIQELVKALGYDNKETEEEDSERATIRERIVDELKWLRRDIPPLKAETTAEHALLCPLSHRLMQEPAKSADGFTYERNALHEWFLAAGVRLADSPMQCSQLFQCPCGPSCPLFKESATLFHNQGLALSAALPFNRHLPPGDLFLKLRDSTLDVHKYLPTKQ